MTSREHDEDTPRMNDLFNRVVLGSAAAKSPDSPTRNIETVPKFTDRELAEQIRVSRVLGSFIIHCSSTF